MTTRKAKTASTRLSEDIYVRVKAYAEANGETVSSAIAELTVKGLAADGLDLYSSELGNFLRGVMAGVAAGMREDIGRAADEIEDRVARTVSRSTKGSLASAAACTDIVRAVYPALREREAQEVWDVYWRRAGELQAGKRYGEAVRDASKR